MKRTDYLLCVGRSSGYPVYRAIMQKDGRYFIRHKKQVVDVTEDFQSKKQVIHKL